MRREERGSADRRLMGPPLAAGLAILAALASPARGDDPVERMVLGATLNEAQLGDVLVVRRGGRLMIHAADMERAGLLADLTTTVTVGVEGQPFVPLDRLRGVLSSELDEAAGTLRMSVDPDALRTTVIDAGRGSRAAGQAPEANPSAFANYALRYSDDSASAGLELGAAWGAGALRSDLSYSERHGVVRGLSVLTVDDVPQRRRWSLGDVFATGGALGGAGLLGGFQVTTDYALQPGTSPMPSFGETGVALTPSVVEVYSNGSLVRQTEIPPGPYRVADLPVTVGANDARVVVRDAFGRSTELRHAFYVAGGSLAPGVSRYAYAAGFLRNELGTESFDYGRLVFIGAQRRGLNPILTVGGRLEAAERLLCGGPAATLRLPVGELELAAGVSRDSGEAGSAGQLGYSFLSRRFSSSAQLKLTSARYATTTLRAADDRSLLEASVVVGSSPGSAASLSLLFGVLHMRSGDEEARVSISTNFRLGARSSLALGLGWRVGSELGLSFEGYVALRLGLDGGHAATVSGRSSPLGAGMGAEVNRGIGGLEDGIGWKARASTAEGEGGDRPVTTADGAVAYQHPFGRVALDARWDREVRFSGEAAGGLVMVGGRIAPTRTVNGGFALIRVPGIEGVRGYLNNHEVGRTDASGDLVVPAVMPYEPVQLSVNDEDIPGEYRVGETRKSVALYRYAGRVASFDVAPIVATRGTVIVVEPSGKRLVPKNGELWVRSREPVSSPIGSSGQFELEGLAPGVYDARIAYSGGECTFRLVVRNPGAEPVSDVGELECAR